VTTFDALFAPLPPVESMARVWVYEENQLRPLVVRTGISDGQNSELLEGDVQEGTEFVTNVIIDEVRTNATSPFPGGRGGFPVRLGGGGGGGGGNRRGG
jgi:hypothetical protein